MPPSSRSKTGPYCSSASRERADGLSAGHLQVDHERDAGVKPVTVQRLDLCARRQPAQMQKAFSVVTSVDRLADRLPCALELERIVDFARASRVGAQAKVKSHARIGT